MAPETGTLPTMEVEAIPELTEAAKHLRDVRRERMQLTKQEVKAQDEVMRLMHERKIETYKDDNFDPPIEAKLVKGKEKVKVSGTKDDDDGDSDD